MSLCLGGNYPKRNLQDMENLKNDRGFQRWTVLFAGGADFGVNHVDVSENSGTPKSSILIGFSIINHPFWGTTIFGNTYVIFLSEFPFMILAFDPFSDCQPKWGNRSLKARGLVGWVTIVVPVPTRKSKGIWSLANDGYGEKDKKTMNSDGSSWLVCWRLTILLAECTYIWKYIEISHSFYVATMKGEPEEKEDM